FQAEDGIRDGHVTGVQTCALPILKATEQYGADVLRLMVASMDYADDIRISERGIKEMSESYRKIRNTFRYILGNLEDYVRFDPRSEERRVGKECRSRSATEQ